VVTGLTVAENLALRRRTYLNWRSLALHNGHLNTFAGRLIRSFEIDPPNVRFRVGDLSAGNLQKVLLAREIDFAQELLLVQNPIGGLDVHSAQFVRHLLRSKAIAGTSIVVQSEDVDELVGLADRVIVISKGMKSTELAGPTLSRYTIGQALSEGLTKFPRGFACSD